MKTLKKKNKVIIKNNQNPHERQRVLHRATVVPDIDDLQHKVQQESVNVHHHQAERNHGVLPVEVYFGGNRRHARVVTRV